MRREHPVENVSDFLRGAFPPPPPPPESAASKSFEMAAAEKILATAGETFFAQLPLSRDQSQGKRGGTARILNSERQVRGLGP